MPKLFLAMAEMVNAMDAGKGVEMSKFKKTGIQYEQLIYPTRDVLYLTGYNELGETSTWMIHGKKMYTITFIVNQDNWIDPVTFKSDIQRETIYDADRDKELSVDFNFDISSESKVRYQGWPRVEKQCITIRIARKSKYWDMINYIKAISEDYNIELCETKYTPEARYIEQRGIEYSTWIEIDKSSISLTYEGFKFTRSAKEYIIYDDESIIPCKDHPIQVPIKFASFDIETSLNSDAVKKICSTEQIWQIAKKYLNSNK